MGECFSVYELVDYTNTTPSHRCKHTTRHINALCWGAAQHNAALRDATRLVCRYEWDFHPALPMVQYIHDHNQTVWGFELGNEVNNRAFNLSILR